MRAFSVTSLRPLLCGLLLVGLVCVLSCCSSARFLPPGSSLLSSVSVTSDKRSVKPSAYRSHVRQEANSRWFNCLKVPLGIYCLSGTDSTKRANRFFRKVGEAPVVYDQGMTDYTVESLRAALFDAGYLRASVTAETRRSGHKTKLTYRLSPGDRYYVDSIAYEYDSPGMAALIEQLRPQSLLYKGMGFDAARLEAERSRIVRSLRNAGYYYLNNEFVTFVADTCAGELGVGVTLRFACPEGTDSARAYKRYRYAEVRVHDGEADSASVRAEQLDGMVLLTGEERNMKPRVFNNHVALRADSLYRENDVQYTYSSLNSLAIVNYTNVRIAEPADGDSAWLDCDIYMNYNPPHNISLELEGTNTAGDLGAALTLAYTNRNLLRGAESFSVKARGAYEAITGLEGYSNSNYIEYGLEASLRLPTLRLPLGRRRMDVRGTSEYSLMYDSQDRPEFHRRVLTGAWTYRWQRHDDRRWQHRLDLFSINYVFMPWISDTFRENYLEDDDSRNAILRYSYENLFIMKWGYSLTFNSSHRAAASPAQLYQSNAWQLRLGAEAAGNLLYLASSLLHAPRDADGQYTLFNIAFSQYVKFDVDFTKNFLINERNSVAMHAAFGIALPYGNSTILPYETRYFSGGANSVRGWSVRGLGPGSYVGEDGTVDFVNQTGNLKLDLSVEYRTHLFWKLHGALFVDAGNIWLTRHYDGFEEGLFRFSTFWRQIAVAYGLGLRLNFDYFILRFDGGMKAINPAYTDARRHYPIIHPDFGRDFTFHFAVGLPF